MSSAAEELILAERQRQIAVEGWTPEHDDHHDDGEMRLAAIAYLREGTADAKKRKEDGTPVGWPWEAVWWKPKDRRANLVRAGALLLAERDRLIRRSDRLNAFAKGQSLRSFGRPAVRSVADTGEVERLLREVANELARTVR